MMIAVMTSLTYIRSVVSDITLSLISSPTPTATAVSTGTNSAASGIDPAWIGAGGAVLAAIIAGVVAIYLAQRSAQQAEELLRLQKKLDAQQVRDEREQKRQETDAEAAQ